MTCADLKAQGLGAQAAQHVIKRVADAYTTLRANLRAGNLSGENSRRRRKARAAVGADSSGKELQAIVDGLRAAGLEIAGDRLKTRPRGTPEDHPRLDLLRHRSLHAREGWPAVPWMATREAVTRVRDAWRRLRPLVEWGDEHVGPPDFSR
ncbi:DUF2461 family protein [Actinomadura physcomitrii]|uniref:DUF2461 family protein n=1 Tax=Actinomadura physcomitrii TaxID=2650748 RepID=UPI001F392D5B|nr:DUF2461 family protein [Actinomadura physcomitrii]